ncbi:hypothetical protein EMIHUDRAFT_421454 [Emiliania huxleyi CCMP1516]|uniref:JmjC domain-containing protein n=2 Tax=Emiliania huxleyi TaxID=2903 RepID=A0A0D3IZL3_EMIH1|nr:hypothetical protein EMIHUDRAFT_424990 [Emiliania huxleyi CCMP1516]XP_005777004.1 hypothetical protein EMIHUDRAFT_421454 [Emiliania huxleyi CCMP1516]EOD16698.1 hypothetical protein EMIHUDRAFT_424990 [Emiliania huxleyi CCMP1516]EOD24575.1 hypothetical protein EMIHUDRAFT_421454 [Emiliania huxleyi CCMP1516]|eukprot:XP_005769127.1 hypothetical protein EMIHUDRAFT_424990 [Emiliania huxleyi CCMP1516]
MSDAVNVLVHVAPSRGGGGSGSGGGGGSAHAVASCRDEVSGGEGDWLSRQRGTGVESAIGAVWDIWAAEDEPRLSAFLARVASERGEAPAHPIHDQCFYVGRALRERLAAEEGVRGWRFVQRQGEAVFIPAGCPHQVLNVRACIKVAQDFVSPEHLPRCLSLLDAFRPLPRAHKRSEDLLGPKAIAAHAASRALHALGAHFLHQPPHESQPPQRQAPPPRPPPNPPPAGTPAGTGGAAGGGTKAERRGGGAGRAAAQAVGRSPARSPVNAGRGGGLRGAAGDCLACRGKHRPHTCGERGRGATPSPKKPRAR